jgi:hypothetical protein
MEQKWMQIMSDANLVEVYGAISEFEAEVVKGKLLSRGIPAMIKRQGLTLMGGVGDFVVLVPAGWEREARAALDSGSVAGLES